jgi:hypothetical protein
MSFPNNAPSNQQKLETRLVTASRGTRGGFESLIRRIPFDCDRHRTATKWSPGEPTLRLTLAWRMSKTSRLILIAGLRR